MEHTSNWQDLITHINPRAINKITILGLIKLSEKSPSGKFSITHPNGKKSYTITIEGKTMHKHLYYHKTDFGAEYLTDKWIQNPDGSKEGIFENASIIVRIDGDIKKAT